jgi:histidinol-phosphate aminotransferase
MAAAAGEMWKYCDPESHDLRTGLANELGVSAENIVIGEGIDGLLGLTVRQYAGAGAPVVTSLGAYPTFNYHVAGFGARLVAVPYSQDREDLGALLAAVKRERAPLVYLANPDNPMGTWWKAGEVAAFIEALPETTMLVLDEAYGEMAPGDALPAIDAERPNVLRMRTFSKAYGLAGLRCGYCVGEAAVIRAFNRVRNHFGVTRMAQAACLAALDDRAYLETVVGRVAACRERIAEIARKAGLAPIPSATNFVAIDCGDGKRALSILNALIEDGIFVRKPMAPVLDRTIRVSCGPEAEMALFEEALARAVHAIPA